MAKVTVVTEDGQGNVVETRQVEIPDEQANADALAAKVASVLDALEQADAGWETLTAAQRTAAMRLAVRASAKLARLVLGKLEAS
jgi:hypothetical protein